MRIFACYSKLEERGSGLTSHTISVGVDCTPCCAMSFKVGSFIKFPCSIPPIPPSIAFRAPWVVKQSAVTSVPPCRGHVSCLTKSPSAVETDHHADSVCYRPDLWYRELRAFQSVIQRGYSARRADLDMVRPAHHDLPCCFKTCDD